MNKVIVNPGDRYNSLSIIEEIFSDELKCRTFRCMCDCGNETIVALRNIRNGHIKSCGKCNYTPIKIGDKFGHLTVIGGYVQGSGYHKNYLCECDCKDKTQKYIDEQNLKRGFTTSCGCVAREQAKQRLITHGQSNTRLFSIWVCMKDRCYNSNNSHYKYYGGRGIYVCDEWHDSFEKFYEWAISHGYNEKLTIDRINVDGNYEPNNCRWATNKEQNNNRRSNLRITYNGETHTVTEWESITGIKRQCITDRYKKGYPLEDVFFYGKFPPRRRRII